MGKIYVVGLGPGNVNCLTLGALDRLNSGYINILRTENHPTISYLKGNNIPYESYDYVYEEKENFKEVYNYIVEDLIRKSEEYGVVNYFVPGNPLVAEKTVEILLDYKKEKDIEIDLISGM
ncbi:SAM-dependent methyltransferase, partial [Anaerosalibacter bizertensis]|nr:SAM-dependent methyltransferase [Anaerosalibacter bizertensis]